MTEITHSDSKPVQRVLYILIIGSVLALGYVLCQSYRVNVARQEMTDNTGGMGERRATEDILQGEKVTVRTPDGECINGLVIGTVSIQTGYSQRELTPQSGGLGGQPEEIITARPREKFYTTYLIIQNQVTEERQYVNLSQAVTVKSKSLDRLSE